MKKMEMALQISNGIRSLALMALKEFSAAQPAYNITRWRTICPVDYMRYAEFDAILRFLEFSPQMKILDVLARSYLSVSHEITGRSVNISAKLKKA